jgi:hypothetical protein
LSFEFD